jgi:hypothetical protein
MITYSYTFFEDMKAQNPLLKGGLISALTRNFFRRFFCFREAISGWKLKPHGTCSTGYYDTRTNLPLHLPATGYGAGTMLITCLRLVTTHIGVMLEFNQRFFYGAGAIIQPDVYPTCCSPCPRNHTRDAHYDRGAAGYHYPAGIGIKTLIQYMNFPDVFLILFHKFFERVGREVRAAFNQPSGVDRVGLKDCFYEVFKPLLEVWRHCIPVPSILTCAANQVRSGVFECQELLLDMFSVPESSHDYCYTYAVH